MNGINIPAIFVANAMGVVLLFSAFLGKSWKMHNSGREDKTLLAMILFNMICCIADPICFLFDGSPGTLARIAVYGGNLTLYVGSMVVGPLWLQMIVEHIGTEHYKLHRLLINIFLVLSTLLLAANFFYPLIFSVNEDNIYTRGPIFWFFGGAMLFFMVDGMIVYLVNRFNGGKLKVFPILHFVVPITLGIVAQKFIYGLSLVWPAMAIGITSMMIGLQDENIYQDRLTGLYNRFYLEEIKSKLKENESFAVMMMDLNDFKAINDKYGHSEGDVVINVVAEILRRIAGRIGSAIRYAGDEFVVVLNTDSPEIAKGCVTNIRHELEKYNASSGKPYEISLAIGYGIFDLKEKSMDELLKQVDHLMYRDKNRFYAKTGKDRRKR